MDLLTVGCIATVVVVAAGVTVYTNRKRRRIIAAQERRQAERRTPPLTETRGPFAVDAKTEKVTITGSKISGSGLQDLGKVERFGPANGRAMRASDRQDPARRSRDDIAHAAERKRRRSEDSSDDLTLGVGLGYLAGSMDDEPRFSSAIEEQNYATSLQDKGGSFGGGGASSSWGGDSSSSSSSSCDSSSSSDSGSSCSSSD